jgi:glycosyltransferase involved in cell wall biosynthesis
VKRSAIGQVRRVLYLTYDGLTDPLGRSQILPYLEGLAARGHGITVISCEKPGRLATEGDAVRAICECAGIDWHPLLFRKHPPVISSVIDILQMKRRAAQLFRQQPFDLVHCRSYMAALVGHSLKRRFGVPFLFDMRGFWADERIERGFWPRGNPIFQVAYGAFKRWERRFFRDADAIVSLTDAARIEVESWPASRRPGSPVSVIPCCVDLELFDPAGGKARAAGRRRLRLSDDQPLLLYVGSLGPGYAIDAMFGLFRVFRSAHPGARYLFITHHSRQEVLALARYHGIEPAEIMTTAGRRDEMPALVAAGDVGVSIIDATFAAKASCPTKVGEMLAMGVPVIANSGVGDTSEILRDSGAGAVLDSFDEPALHAAVAMIDRARLSPEKVRGVAIRWFNLKDGIARYDSIYRSIEARPADHRPLRDR